MVQLSQSPGLGPEGRGEDLRRLAMLEWTLAGRALMMTRGNEKMGFGSKILIPLNRRLVYVARGVDVKTPQAFRIRVTRGREPILGAEAEERYITEIGHYSYRYTEFGEEPALQCRRQFARRTRRH